MHWSFYSGKHWRFLSPPRLPHNLQLSFGLIVSLKANTMRTTTKKDSLGKHWPAAKWIRDTTSHWSRVFPWTLKDSLTLYLWVNCLQTDPYFHNMLYSSPFTHFFLIPAQREDIFFLSRKSYWLATWSQHSWACCESAEWTLLPGQRGWRQATGFCTGDSPRSGTLTHNRYVSCPQLQTWEATPDVTSRERRNVKGQWLLTERSKYKEEHSGRNGHSGASPAGGSQHGGPPPALCLASLACTLKKVLVQDFPGGRRQFVFGFLLCYSPILILQMTRKMNLTSRLSRGLNGTKPMTGTQHISNNKEWIMWQHCGEVPHERRTCLLLKN